jgi:gluconate 5-dehydrogenase
MSTKEMFDLSGRRALITGGSRGLGLAMAQALGEMRARVIITARKAAELEEAVASLRARGIEASSVVNDLAKFDDVKSLVDAALAAGPIDILINNAGTTWGAPAEEYPFEGWKKVLDLNLTGTFLLTQQVGARSMIPNHYGRIVNIASVAGLQGSRPELLRAIAYHTSKGGLVNFTRALAAEWGQHGITVNAICPGFIPSKMSQGILEKVAPRVIEATPLKQIGRPEDLQGLVVLFSSKASNHITGQIIAVDGGASIV